MFLSFLAPLLSYDFWSRIGFLISYICTSFLVLEVLRLVYTDANKREVEKLLDSYTKQRSGSPRRNEGLRKVPLEALERPHTPPNLVRPRRAATTPESEKTLVTDREEKRRRRAQSAASQLAPTATHVPAQQTSTPPRRLRKRSDTLNSTGSAELKSSSRRRREDSPASEAGSKASSRQVSPLRRMKREEKTGGMGVGLGFNGLVRGKV